MKRINVLSLLAFAGITFTSTAGVISVGEAENTACEFYRTGAGGDMVEMQLVTTGGTPKRPYYYVFNSSDGHGFVIVSAEESTVPILGYSFSNAFMPESVPEPMQWLMAGIGNEIKESSGAGKALDAATRRSMVRRVAARGREVLLKTPEWSQESPFNSSIPGRPLTGCVGTAMASIMKYYNFPERGTGSFDGVNFDVTYDWDNMRMDNYRNGYTQSEGDAVSLLVYHAAKSVDTKFGMSGSSAYEVRVPAAMSNYFGYDPGVSYRKRSDVATQGEWDNLVLNEINNGRPVLYCGQDVTSGHAFICDGYDGNGYFHFNWGWGGAANGYFLTSSLNPTVSTTHNFNNLNTIIYNIKPGNGDNSVWSPVRITSDGNQPGMGSDLTDLTHGKKFAVRTGNLKNLSYVDFNGQYSVALFDAAGNFKTLLSEARTLTLKSMTALSNGYVDFRECCLPEDTEVSEGDMVRMATSSDNGATWLPMAGELLTVNEIPADRTEADSFLVKFPATVSGVTVDGVGSVVKGWDYSFRVIPDNPAEDVVTVRSNGYILNDNGEWCYTVSNVREDQQIEILVQKASEVVAKRSMWVAAPGTLESIVSDTEAGTIKDLTLFGTIDSRDFDFIRTRMQLTRLDLSAVSIAANGTNQSNAIPKQAFNGLSKLKEVVLPNNVTRLNNGCFRQSGITSIVIPASVSTYEYNVFCGARSLRDIWVGRETAEFINWCVLSGVNVGAATLHVPNERAVANYKAKENWNTIATIKVDPVPACNDYSFAVMENADVNYNSATLPGRLEKGTKVIFKATHIAGNDDRMDVYANNTLLKPSSDGTYTATVNGNTIIHFDLVHPIAKSVHPSFWKLTDKGGSVGLLTDVVNVIPGREFVIRANALNVPEEWKSMFWAAALTDSEGNIKEFISPVSAWTGPSGDGLKMNITCCVRESTVREGNMIRLVTSTNKKTWSVVEGSNSDVVAALPAINNMTPVYNIRFPELDNATVSGVVPTAVRGRDMTIKIVPKNVSDRINVSLNGEPLFKEAPSVTYSFIAKEDMEFDVEVYSPKVIDEVVYNVTPGELPDLVTASTVKPRVIVVGSVYPKDLKNAFQQTFVQKSVTHVDLSGVTIVKDNSDKNTDANTIPGEMFYTPSATQQVVPAVQEVILPESVVRLNTGAFSNCSNIKEMRLPAGLATYDGFSSGKGGLMSGCFNGCSGLTTLYVPSSPVNHKVHQFDFSSNLKNNLGLPDPSRVTVVVNPEYLDDYLTEDGKLGDTTLVFNGGNGWYNNGFNIVSEYPVYSVNFDATRFTLTDEGFDTDRAVSFLGDNVKAETVTLSDRIIANSPSSGGKVRVYDNGSLVGTLGNGNQVPVTFHNPSKRDGKSGNHELTSKYYFNVSFNLSSDMFVVNVPEVRNNESLGNSATEFEMFNYYDILRPEITDVAEGSPVRFSVRMNSEHGLDIEPRVKVADQVIGKDEEGCYTVDVRDGDVSVEVFAVPVNGATLGQSELDAIDAKEAVDITEIALEGDIKGESLAELLRSFVSLETLDLSGYKGEIADGMFADRANLKTVVLPAVDNIGNGAFKGCDGLTTVILPESVNRIGDEAFSGCRSLASLTLTGVESVGSRAFAGCDNMTALYLNSQMTSAPASVCGRGVSRRAAVSADAFDGLNPNCIVILDTEVAVPAAKANFLTTTIGTVVEEIDGETVEREGRIYTLQNDVEFNDAYPLDIPYSFEIGAGHRVSMSHTPGTCSENGNWSAYVLPFDARSEDGKCEVATAGEDGYFRPVELIPANTPFIARMAEGEVSRNVTFSAIGKQVPATPGGIAVDCGSFTLGATYRETSMPEVSTCLLNDMGTAFVSGSGMVETCSSDMDAEGMVTLAPFTVYATDTEGSGHVEINFIKDVETGTGTSVQSADGIKISQENGLIVIYSSEACNMTVYSADGRVVRTLDIEEGRNEVGGFERGIYIVGGIKIRL